MITLETEYLILREPAESDFAAIHEYGSDPEVTRYMTFGPNTEKNTSEYIKKCMNQRKQNPRIAYSFVIELKSDSTVIGGCGIEDIDFGNKKANIGYCLNKKYWGQGYAVSAARELLKFGFNFLHLNRIEATCDEKNLQSKRVLEKLGMHYEGCMRDHMFIRGNFRNSLLFSILSKELL